MSDLFREFEPVLLAALLAPVFMIFHIFLFRRRKENRPGYVQLPLAFGSYGLLWLVVFTALRGLGTPADYLAGFSMVGFICLAYMQVFSLTVRGFSLRILVDITDKGQLDFHQIINGYAGGRGLDWMFEKRVTGLESLHLVRRENGMLCLEKPFGFLAGWIGIWTKAALKIGAGG